MFMACLWVACLWVVCGMIQAVVDRKLLAVVGCFWIHIFQVMASLVNLV